MFAAPNPTFNANYYRETTWKGSGAIPVYPPPGHALVTAYLPGPVPTPVSAFRSAPPVIASSSPAPTPGAHQREYTLDPVQRLRALLDAESDSDETPSPEKPVHTHTRSISASSSASLMDRKLLGNAPTSPITVSLMERTLERKAMLMARRGNPVEEEYEPELTPSPVAAVVALPPEVDEPPREPQEDFVIDPKIMVDEATADVAGARPQHAVADAQPVQPDEEPDVYDPALALDEAFETQASVPQADVEDEVDEQDDSGYRSSNSSPGVPLALLLTKRKNDKQRQQDLSTAFTFSMPPQSPMSDLRSTARNNIRKKGKRKSAKSGVKSKKKKAAPAPAEAEAEAEEEQPAAEEHEDEGQELIVPQRFATPPPPQMQPQSSPSFPRSPFRTPLTSRNTGGEFAAGSPVRRDLFSTPKRPFVLSPFKTPALTEDPFNAAAVLERTLEELPQGSPLRDRPWGHDMYHGYSLYGDYY
ncbi:hypothetical protein AURDEDRAFT_114543 [Auricularia subglabra TFB-10046 SS5]|nr:hypothetical protein AURDEDRAFT_114543 [Auricularia subglabra TFB-10046 SS5]